MCTPARHDLIDAICCEMLARPLGPDVSPVVGDPLPGLSISSAGTCPRGGT
jgi:hypothetical protein